VLAAAGSVTEALVLGTTASRIGDIGVAGAGVWWTMFLLSIGATLAGLLLLTGVTGLVSLQRKVFADRRDPGGGGHRGRPRLRLDPAGQHRPLA
jgi:hypothetical protein